MSAKLDVLGRKVFEEYARASGNCPNDHFDRNAAEQWMAHALEQAGVAELIEAADRVRMIPSPVGSGHPHGSPEDRAYIEGFMYALRLVREPGFACGLDARLARVRGAA